jgi:hypothetical protein
MVSSCHALARLLMTHLLMDLLYWCSLRAEIRQAFEQAVLSAWDIFFWHYSFIKMKVKCQSFCGAILKEN